MDNLTNPPPPLNQTSTTLPQSHFVLKRKVILLALVLISLGLVVFLINSNISKTNQTAINKQQAFELDEDELVKYYQDEDNFAHIPE